MIHSMNLGRANVKIKLRKYEQIKPFCVTKEKSKLNNITSCDMSVFQIQSEKKI